MQTLFRAPGGPAAGRAQGADRPAPAGEVRTVNDQFWPVPDVLAHLGGRWRVGWRFEGTTLFRPLPDGGLLHEESGTFTWQGVPRPAERTLRFLPGARPGTADVRFADGRPFHDLDLTTGRHTADHPCAADLYHGDFTVQDADHWRTVWRVGGPTKDLVLTTDYTRETD